jgi:hypothetical protein
MVTAIVTILLIMICGVSGYLGAYYYDLSRPHWAVVTCYDRLPTVEYPPVVRIFRTREEAEAHMQRNPDKEGAFWKTHLERAYYL